MLKSQTSIVITYSFFLLFPLGAFAQELGGFRIAYFFDQTLLLASLIILLITLIYLLAAYFFQISRLKFIFLDLLFIIVLPLAIRGIDYLFLLPDFFNSLYQNFSFGRLFYAQQTLLLYPLIYPVIFFFLWKLGRSELFIHILVTTILAFSFPAGYNVFAEKILTSSSCQYNLFLDRGTQEFHASNCVFNHVRVIPYSEMLKVCENIKGISQEECLSIVDQRINEEAVRNKQNPDLCTDISDLQRRDFCYLDASARAKDAAFCNRISSNNQYAEILIPKCIYLATPTEDLTLQICDAIPHDELNTDQINQLKNRCYADIAKFTRNSAICAKISGSDRFYCQEAVR